MKKSCLVGQLVLWCAAIGAREFRTPLSLYRHSMHEIECAKNDDWYLDVWSAFYQRKASEGLGCSGEKVPLSTLLFGKDTFEVQEAFAEAEVPFPLDQYITTRLSPCLEYSDKGAFFGIDVARNIRDWLRIGLRIKLPVRSFSMKSIGDPGFSTGITQSDFVVCQQRGNAQSCAYRLDFLSQLPVDFVEPGVRFKMVNYANQSFPLRPITMSNQDVTNNPMLNGEDRNPVTVLKQADGSVPNQSLSIPLGVAQSLPPLSADGSNIANGERARFTIDIDYTALDNNRSAQEMLWVVNSIENGSPVDPALILQDHVLQLLACLGAESAEDLLCQCGISFNAQKVTGFGDLDAEWYNRFYWEDVSFTEVMLGLRLPTGKRQENPGALLREPLGNNGHVEVRLRTRTYWEPCSWLFLQTYFSYSFVTNRVENVAAPFLGACVKNIGPCIPAKINWGYFLGHLELGSDLMHASDCHSLKGLIGYQAYLKHKDRICLQESAQDCLGRFNALCAQLLSRNTDVTAHTLYGEVSYDYSFDKTTLGVFGGVCGVVAGKNTPVDRDWYIGLECCF